MPSIYNLPRDWFKEDKVTDFRDLYERQKKQGNKEEMPSLDGMLSPEMLYDITNGRRINNRGRNRMETFWICWVEYTDGGRHYRHYSLEAACNEAERLARLPDVQGKNVYLFKCVGKCHVEETPVKWDVPCAG